MTESFMLISEDHLGLHVRGGPPECNRIKTLANTWNIRAYDVSVDGKFVAYSDNVSVKVEDLDNLVNVFHSGDSGVQFLKISPKNTVLLVWFVPKADVDHTSVIYDIKTGSVLQSYKQKQIHWCLSWSADEFIAVKNSNGELHFYENNDYSRYVKRFSSQKVSDFSISTSQRGSQVDYFFATLTLGAHGQPNFVRLYRYPEISNAIANKSFFRANRVSFKWSPKGDACLLLCSADEDKTGKTYYGEQILNYLNASGLASSVSLNKEGPVQAVEWHPSAKESTFAVIYGLFPPRTAIFNQKCQMIYDFGELQTNEILFNYPFGNLLALCGFGNLRAGIFIYNYEKKALIAQIQSEDTTHVSWAPDALHILTAVTSPRMRQGNCFRVWHYTGKMLYEEKYPDGDSLRKINWRPTSQHPSTPPMIIESSILVKTFKKETQASKYVPPHLRNSATGEKPKPANPQSLSEKEKKLKSLEKKLEAIKKLKKVLKQGGHLEKNQLEKISKEEELRRELKDLKVNA